MLWLGMITFWGLAALIIFTNEPLDWYFWGALGLGALFIPDKKYQKWLHETGDRIGEWIGKAIVAVIGLGIVIGLIWGFFALVGSFFDGVGGIGKFEGLSAEEWYYEYADAEYRVEQLQSQLYEYQDFVENCFEHQSGVLICPNDF